MQTPRTRPDASAAGPDWPALAADIGRWGRALGFQEIGIAGTDLDIEERQLIDWLAAGRHGAMDYMARHGATRARPRELVPGTLRVITARMNYRPPGARASAAVLDDPTKAFVARYALGRDYHKVLRGKLQQLADRIASTIGDFGYRVFTDSAPVLEVALAAKSGIGWQGKHTLLLTRDAGSWFFLGEIYTDLPLPETPPQTPHCGSCSACIDICPTGAIVAPYELDARRCISYLTIELPGSIPEALRPLIGNRVYGCDDCQLCCPWNRFAQDAHEPDFAVRNGLDDADLVALFAWTEAEFTARLAGSAIRRIGFERWSRNLAVGLGNAPGDPGIINALAARADDPSALVREHVAWALARHLGADCIQRIS
jgi:epoxyqueuosine reductase